MSQSDQQRSIVHEFNSYINNRDIDGLATLMTEDHVFTDSDNNALEGRAEVLDAWRGFFESFPDYRNHFEELVVNNERVVVIGRSTCALDTLNGPALWRVRIDGNRVAEWRVYEDTPENRVQLHVA
jgi:ketosteroid isomerase-like protein